MKSKSPLFIEYIEIRRRIEQRFAGMQLLLGHLLVFLIAIQVILERNYLLTAYYMDTFGKIDMPDIGFDPTLLVVWSFVLLGHGLWVYLKSGAYAKARDAAIREQLRERLEEGDTELLGNPRESFRLHGLLEDDIRNRSGVLVTTLVLLAWNAITWLIWNAQGRYSSYPWMMTAFTACITIIPAVAINYLRRTRRDSRYSEILTNWSAQSESERKPKRKRGEDETTVRLSDDGELIEEYWTKSNMSNISKAKR